jgi:hypothetical protein
MRARSGYSPERRIAAANRLTPVKRVALAARMNYGGNLEHLWVGGYGLPRFAEEAA